MFRKFSLVLEGDSLNQPSPRNKGQQVYCSDGNVYRNTGNSGQNIYKWKKKGQLNMKVTYSADGLWCW